MCECECEFRATSDAGAGEEVREEVARELVARELVERQRGAELVGPGPRQRRGLDRGGSLGSGWTVRWC